jgi:CRP-like cAMP-binding protein
MKWHEKKKKDAPKQAMKRSPAAEAFGDGLARKLDENAFREAAALKALGRAMLEEFNRRLVVTPSHTQHGMRDDKNRYP